MKNLEQIRAKNALLAAKESIKGKNDGEVVKKIPAMIQQNGFIGALAFAIEDEHDGKNADSGYAKTFRAIIKHLADRDIALYAGTDDLDAFASWLCSKQSDTLRVVTAEAMAYLSILRRFAKKGDDDANRN
ncbi:type III-B CRISPR module-associated protein Cmr5 [Oligosphaera ethanolica]|uniref:CRISPR type III-B/RAMP module-associated protein Cmr5 n=1 Tax=Oligosphaera ethanolica TaxID=760260 RepID=A0AAE4ANB1_9BACT|nr:type III-B CRISPR module-associated protein Cmr5 [Oligosphaera ethanolica]MDQ0289436.1 CRISPR type III-B/RAMP module-associated protein Cmr5 [Oligosphaera ethanolica]